MAGNPLINNIPPDTGREYKEDGTVINTADLLYNAVDKSGGIRSITEFQNAVHSGYAFSFTNHGTMLAGASISFLGITGALQVHFDGLEIAISQGAVLLEFYEAPTITSNGTVMNMRRRNRANPNRPTINVYSNPTITANGTLLEDELFPQIGNGANVLSGNVGLDEGWVLSSNTSYLIKLTNQAATTTTYNVKFAWHEAPYIV
ncbi:MAG TPA: hypothetical protein VFM18_22285 [Methanosarcina sp.]|nr:hypothetical protein [Methanosarcina sp.]